MAGEAKGHRLTALMYCSDEHGCQIGLSALASVMKTASTSDVLDMADCLTYLRMQARLRMQQRGTASQP